MNTLYVTDLVSNNIQIFDNNGNFLNKLDSSSIPPVIISQPSDIAIDNADNIYVSELSGRMTTIYSTPIPINHFGLPGSGKDQFNGPRGIHVTNYGTIYVADSANRRIVVLFEPNSWTTAGTTILGTLPLNQNLTLQNGYNLQIQPMIDTTSSTPITSDGKLSVISGATLTANNGSSITARSMEIDNTSTFNLNDGSTFSITEDIISNGTWQIQGARTISNNVTGTGQISKTNPGELAFDSNSVTADTVNIQQGSFKLTNATLNATTNLSSTVPLTIEDSATLTGSIVSTDNIIKTGNGEALFDNNDVTANNLDIQQGDVRTINTSFYTPINIATNSNLYLEGVNVMNNNITGTGNIVKTGIGESVFEAATSIAANNLNIEEGSLRFVDSTLNITNPINIAFGAGLVIDFDSAISTNITGAGNITKRALGELSFNFNEVTANSLDVQQGSLKLNNVRLTTNTTITSGSPLTIEGNNTVIGNITSNASLIKTGLGELLSNNNTITATNLDIQQGDVRSAGTNYNTPINIATGSNFILFNNNNLFEDVSGTGNIIKNGLGTTNFNNNTITTPALDIQQGTIVLNNSNINAPVTVGNSAKLKGTGAILSNLINNGIVAPGASPGIITVTGNYTTAPGASLESYIAPSASPVAGIDYSQLLVNGTADITANNLVVNAAIGSYTNGAEYQLLTADNGINGEFANYTLNITGPYEAPITYTPNQVLLTIVKKDIPHIPDIPPSLTIKHANSLVDYINSLTNMSPDFIKILDVLDKLPIDERDNAVKSMSPNRNLTANYVNQDMNQLIQGITSARLDIISSHDTNFNAHSNLMATDHNKKDLLSSTKASLINNISSNLNNNWLNSEKHAVWASPFAQFIRQDTSKKGRGYKAKIGGMIIGYDQKLSSSVIGGISLGYYQAMFDHNSHGGNDNKIKGTFATIYGSKTINNSYLNGSLLTAYNNHHLNRQINIPTLATAYATSKHRSYEVSPRVELGYNIKTDCNYQITPFAATEYSIIFENGYTEKGANALDMRVKSGQNHLFTNELGIKLRKAIKLSSEEELNIKGKLSYINKTRSKKHNKIKSGFKEQTASYSSNNYSKAEHQISPSVEIELNKKNGVSVGGRYSGEFSKSFQAHEALFNLGMQF
ncbi:outer membrane autotransporter barrel protein [Rickettsiales bacterium Ac37b]|nr:outer membrane autotransporter barrel protein [Rickettsiales bacterium Ac37b]